MNHRSIFHATTQIVIVVSLLSGCAVKERTPSVSHVHIGHALNGWFDTPGKAGLFVTAEQEVSIALANADAVLKHVNSGKLAQARGGLENLGHVLDPEQYIDGNGKGYGLKKAIEGAIRHLQFSADSPDASTNVTRSVSRSVVNATDLLDRCDELLALVGEMIALDDLEILAALAPDVRSLAYNIAGGQEKLTADIYGVAELREDIESMVAREDPEYTTVNSFYLFNLIRLPDGTWQFARGGRARQTGVGYR